MRSLSSSIIVLAGAVAFAGASASRGGSIDAVGGIGGILIALIGLVTWLITLEPREPKAWPPPPAGRGGRRSGGPAGVVWLAVAYPLGTGPLGYCANRRWVPSGWLVAMDPVLWAVGGTPLLSPYASYLNWWLFLGERHRAAGSD